MRKHEVPIMRARYLALAGLKEPVDAKTEASLPVEIRRKE
jgi:hypothetical protein